jgi:hypothetical protein
VPIVNRHMPVGNHGDNQKACKSRFMKLPDATTRANLKLNDASQRLLWALAQYFGSMPPNPPVAANPASGINPTQHENWSFGTD